MAFAVIDRFEGKKAVLLFGEAETVVNFPKAELPEDVEEGWIVSTLFTGGIVAYYMFLNGVDRNHSFEMVKYASKLMANYDLFNDNAVELMGLLVPFVDIDMKNDVVKVASELNCNKEKLNSFWEMIGCPVRVLMI